MEKVKCGQVSQVLKKGKKKQAKGELDRLKQAEKKKRRLEKALATSAAIRSELEKKKQKKIEEQQRLDAEGAAVAEAVALHVLIGEDTDDSCHFIMNNNTSKHNPWDYSSDNSHMMGYQNLAKYSVDGLGWATDACVPAWKCNNWGIGLPFPPQFHVKDIQSSSYDEVGRGADLSVGLVAAQAVASLQIAEDSHGAQFAGQGAATVVINKLLGGSNMGNKVNIYRKI